MSQIVVEYMHSLMKDGRSSGGRRMSKSLNEGIDKFDLGRAPAALVPIGRLTQLPLFVTHARLINNHNHLDKTTIDYNSIGQM